MAGRMHRGWHGPRRPGRPGPGRGRLAAGRPARRRRTPRPGCRAGCPTDWFVGAPEVDRRPRGDRHRRRAAARSRASSTTPRPAGRRGRGGGRAGSPGSGRRPATSGSRSPARPSTATSARSPGARGCGDTSELFTPASVPVMTRLRQPERIVLDTLVDAGVARSRSDALAWAVRLVGRARRRVAGRAARRPWRKVDELRAKGRRRRGPPRRQAPERRAGRSREAISQRTGPARSRRGGRSRPAPSPRGRTRGSRTSRATGSGRRVA